MCTNDSSCPGCINTGLRKNSVVVVADVEERIENGKSSGGERGKVAFNFTSFNWVEVFLFFCVCYVEILQLSSLFLLSFQIFMFFVLFC